MKTVKNQKDLISLANKKRQEYQKYSKTITLCAGTGCSASGCQAVLKELNKQLKRARLSSKIRVRATGCHGFCEQGPLMVIEPDNIFYCHIRPKDVKNIVSQTLQNNEILEDLLYLEPVSRKKYARESDIPFYKAQDRTILGQNKVNDPCDIHEYIANGGYTAFIKALTSMQPDKIIQEVTNSGLRGRGGAGFPTGKKWQSCRSAAGTPKYVICNADEGDPGAYMDRSILEGNPHAVIEGMLIGAMAIGAEHGYIYVRNEYPLAVKHAKIAVQQAEDLGLLGNKIMGKGFSLDIKIARGGGAFICGESTALMASLEGKVGEPRPKDIHTTEHGFLDLPSNLNNVETWANIPHIMNKGAKWFSSKGTKESKGTKIFALTGKIKNTGLVEVPMGMSLRDIVYKIGGGSVNGKKIKAVQTGGPSGGCLPDKLLDLPVDYEALDQAGSMVGSGGMVVMDEATCMVDVAKYFLNFLIDESCGKCVPCRLGLSRMMQIITHITEGASTEEELETLEDLADTVSQASLCGLGKTASNPVLSTIKYFRSEYEAHILDKHCPAGVCRSLIKYSIQKKECTGCLLCIKACPHGAIIGSKGKLHVIQQEKCEKCGICMDSCKFNAIMVA